MERKRSTINYNQNSDMAPTEYLGFRLQSATWRNRNVELIETRYLNAENTKVKNWKLTWIES